MPSAYETAYPRLKSSVSNEKLNRSYAPTAADLWFKLHRSTECLNPTYNFHDNGQYRKSCE